MAVKDKSTLLSEAQVIRDETSDGANSALRVGQHLYDLIDSSVIGGGTAETTSYDSTGETNGNLVADKTDLQAAVKEVRDRVNKPTDEGTTFDDSGAITVEKTIEYSTIRTVTGSTHTLTAATFGNVSGNYKKVRYTFDVDCTLTLIDFDETGSTLGTVNPIPAGTYDFWFFTTPFGLALLIQNNTGTTPGTLSTPTLVLSVGNGQAGYVITNIDANATAGVLEYSTDNVNWTTWGSYSFGTETGTITGLTNGVLYYGRYRNSATGYTASAYATDTVTPSAGVTALPQITGLAIDNSEYTELTLTWDATSGNEDNISVERSANGTTGWTVVGTPATSSTTFTDTGLTVGDTWYYRVREIGSISYSNGPYSTTESSLVAYNLSDDFTGAIIDTNKLTVVNLDQTLISVVQNNQLEFRAIGANTAVAAFRNYAYTNLKLQRGDISFQAKHSWVATGTVGTPVMAINRWDLANTDKATIQRTGSGPYYARCVITVGGSSVYDYTSAIDIQNTFKIEMDSNGTIRYYYLSGPDAWTEIDPGSSGGNKSSVMPDIEYVGVLSGNKNTGAVSDTDKQIFDDLHFQYGHYTTSAP